MKSAKRAIAVFSTVVVLACAAAASAADPQSGPFAGATSQSGGSVSFELSAGGTVVTGFKAIMSAQCTKEGAASTSIEVGLTPISKISVHGGTFGHSGGFSLHNGAEVIGHGSGTVSGGFTSATMATGTLHFPWTYFSNAGLLSGYHCDTGKVTFGASFVPKPGSPVAPSPSTSCVVPKLKGKKLKVAKRAVKRENCLPGRVVRRHSAHIKRGRVIAQKPAPGTRMSAGSKVKLVVSSGPAR